MYIYTPVWPGRLIHVCNTMYTREVVVDRHYDTTWDISFQDIYRPAGPVLDTSTSDPASSTGPEEDICQFSSTIPGILFKKFCL